MRNGLCLLEASAVAVMEVGRLMEGLEDFEEAGGDEEGLRCFFVVFLALVGATSEISLFLLEECCFLAEGLSPGNFWGERAI
jgi:hypothetical protein